MAHDVFISYSHIDKTVADAVCHHLERDKIRCWIAPRDITPGDEFADAISDALSKTKLFLLIFSSNSNISKYVLREVELAVKNGLTIVTIKIEDLEPSRSMEFYLSVVHWIDAVDKDLEQQLKKLTDTVANILAAGETPVLKKGPDKSQKSDSTAKPKIHPKKSKFNKKWIIISAAFVLAAATVTFIIINPFNNDTNSTLENLDVPVEITDENLESAIRETLTNMGESVGDEITEEDMLKLNYLIVGNEEAISNLNDRAGDTEHLDRFTSLMIQTENDISSLEGLRYAKNLEALVILGKSIRDLTPISSLENITFIDLYGNEITDWSPLSGMSDLEILVLEDNLLIDISTLSNMDSLRVLNLASNQIENISALKNLNSLESIVLDDNKITDISALRDMRYLEGIALASNNLEDISPLQYLRKAEWLYLDNNYITDISPIAELTEVKYLGLGNNNIRDISPLMFLYNLQILEIHNNNKIQSIQEVCADKLKSIKIDVFTYYQDEYLIREYIDNNIDVIIMREGGKITFRDIEMDYTPSDFGLNPNTIVEFEDDAIYSIVIPELELMGVETNDGVTIKEMFELRYIVVRKEGYNVNFKLNTFIEHRELQNVTDDLVSIEVLQYAKNLELMVLCGFGATIESMDSIRGLDKLKVIILDGNNIDNIDFLQNKPMLHHLELSDNNITDISIMAELTLDSLVITGNNIDDYSPLKSISTLEEVHIDYDGINDIGILDN